MNGHLALAALVLLGVALYALDLRRRPMKSCRRCHGRGKVPGSTSKRWGWCPGCHEKDGKPKPPRKRAGAQLVRPALRRRK